MDVIKISAPYGIQNTIEKLNEKGFEAFLVGGCVRDSLMGRIPSDWDIATNALPTDIHSIFDKTFDTGLKHGTVTVMTQDGSCEITTFRLDKGYSDYRHPDGVEFTSNLEKDLSRRDFTINALAYNSEQGIIDLFSGVRDIKEGIIRTVGDPLMRFNEDALRMLRALRFSAQLGFLIHKDTANAIRNKVNLIDKISRERIREELNKILLSKRPENIAMLYQYGLAGVIFNHSNLKKQNTRKWFIALKYIMMESAVRWALFCYLSGDNSLINSLKFDNATKLMVTKILKCMKLNIKTDGLWIRKKASNIGFEPLKYSVEIKKVLISYGYSVKEDMDILMKATQLLIEIKYKGLPLQIKDLKIDGNDIKRLGVNQGREIGLVLKDVLDGVLENPEINKRDVLISIAAEIAKNKGLGN